MIKERLGLLFVLVGPGGVGKNTLMNNVLKRLDTLNQLPTATTRPIRPTEKPGREHDFYTLETFNQLIESDALIEYQEVRQGQFYGVPRNTVENAINEGRDVIADIEVLGASILKQQYAENTIQIFIAPTTMERLETQMRERGTDEATIQDRMKRAEMEMAYAPLTNYLIVNDNLEHASDELYHIIVAHQNDSAPKEYIHVTYTVTILPHADNAILRPSANNQFLSARLPHGETPEDFAHRLIKEKLHITAENLHLTRGIQLDQLQIDHLDLDYAISPYHYHVTFRYGYLIDKQFPITQDWEWFIPSTNPNDIT